MRELIDVYEVKSMDKLPKLIYSVPNKGGDVVMKLILSKNNYMNYGWQLVEFGYYSETLNSEFEQNLKVCIENIINELADSNYFFYFIMEDISNSKLANSPYIRPSGNNDNVYVCRSTIF